MLDLNVWPRPRAGIQLPVGVVERNGGGAGGRGADARAIDEPVVSSGGGVLSPRVVGVLAARCLRSRGYAAYTWAAVLAKGAMVVAHHPEHAMEHKRRRQ